MYLAFFVLPCCITGAAAIIGLYLLKVLRSQNRLKLNALNTTIVFGALGSAFISASCASTSASILHHNIALVNGSKVSELLLDEAYLIVFGFFFGTLSTLNISLVWIEIGNSASKLKPVSARAVTRYRLALQVYYVTFLCLFVALMFTGRVSLAVIVALPAIAFIVATYFWGWFKLRPLLRSAMDATDQAGRTSKMQVLQRIAETSIALSFWALVLIVSFIAYYLLGGFTGGVTPLVQSVTVANLFIWNSIAMVLAVVISYCYRSIKRTSAKDSNKGKTGIKSNVDLDSTVDRNPHTSAASVRSAANGKVGVVSA